MVLVCCLRKATQYLVKQAWTFWGDSAVAVPGRCSEDQEAVRHGGLSLGKEGLPRSSAAWGWSWGPEERSVPSRGSSLAHRRKWKMICVSGTGVRVGLSRGGKISQRMKDVLGQAEHFGLWSRGWHDKLSFIETEITILIFQENR